jgi:type II secretory pathway pseudopilin PulG
MCIVLLIIAVLAAAAMPAIQGAFTENAIRADSRQLSLMVKTAMLQSGDQHRVYVIDLTNTTMSLHPESDPADDSNASAADDPSGVSVFQKLDPANKLLIPDPQRANGWITIPAMSWTFRPGELCPATRVRFARGESWIEMSFNALTGNVENETAYLP